MLAQILELAYKGEVLFSRLQGIAFQNPRFNGEYRLISTLAPHVKFAVDAGANKGDWTNRLLSQCGNHTQVVAIEPDPANAEYVRRRFEANPNVILLEAAISSKVGTESFSIGEGKYSGTGYLGKSDGGSVQVQLVTLEGIHEKFGVRDFDLIKADIEGEEIAMLRGGEELFRTQKIGTIQIEYNCTWLRSGRRIREAFEFANDHKYALLNSTPFGFMRFSTYGDGLEDYRMRNLILARQDHVEILKPIPAAGRARVEAHMA